MRDLEIEEMLQLVEPIIEKYGATEGTTLKMQAFSRKSIQSLDKPGGKLKVIELSVTIRDPKPGEYELIDGRK